MKIALCEIDGQGDGQGDGLGDGAGDRMGPGMYHRTVSCQQVAELAATPSGLEAFLLLFVTCCSKPPSLNLSQIHQDSWLHFFLCVCV